MSTLTFARPSTEDLSPFAGLDLAHVHNVLSSWGHPSRNDVVEDLITRLRIYDRVSQLEWHYDVLRELVRSAPHDFGMGMVVATSACSASCRARAFWRTLVSEILGSDLAYVRHR